MAGVHYVFLGVNGVGKSTNLAKSLLLSGPTVSWANLRSAKGSGVEHRKL